MVYLGAQLSILFRQELGSIGQCRTSWPDHEMDFGRDLALQERAVKGLVFQLQNTCTPSPMLVKDHVTFSYWAWIGKQRILMKKRLKHIMLFDYCKYVQNIKHV